MIHFIFSDKKKSFGFLKTDTEPEYQFVRHNIMDKFNLMDPICFLPTYTGPPFQQEFIWEHKRPDGTSVFYFPIGLTIPIWKFIKDSGVESDGLSGMESLFKRRLRHSFDEFKSIVMGWGLNLEPRPYQYEAAYKILQWKRSVSSLATRAGKTLIAYMIYRYAMEYLGVTKILMIVPSVELVKQGFSDFEEYGEFFKSECIWSGGKVVKSSNLTIATFQTLINYLDRKNPKFNPHFFDGYDLVFVDETHRATSASIKTIITQPFMENCVIAFGMTGTLPKEDTIDRWCVHSLLGTKIQEIRPRDLMDEGYLSNIQIYQHRLEYHLPDDRIINTWIRCAEYSLSEFDTVPNPKNPRKQDKIPLDHPEFLIAYRKTLPFGIREAKRNIYADPDLTPRMADLKYKEFLESQIKETPGANLLHTEIMTVHFYEERIDYIINLIKTSCPRNTLILAQHVEYVKHIGDRLKGAFPDRPVVVVHGSSKDRKKMKDIFKENENVVMVANYAVVGTGITLSNLCHGILFESFKSEVINLQGIGRGLALVDGKEAYELHDITDCFDKTNSTNKIFLQGLARTKIYKEQEFEYHIVKHTVS